MIANRNRSRRSNMLERQTPCERVDRINQPCHPAVFHRGATTFERGNQADWEPAIWDAKATASQLTSFFLQLQKQSRPLPVARWLYPGVASVEGFLSEVHQSYLLEYHVAETAKRLTFPAKTLERYSPVHPRHPHIPMDT